jgi:hypothetical protein
MGDQGINYVLIDYILLLAGEFYVFFNVHWDTIM